MGMTSMHKVMMIIIPIMTVVSLIFAIAMIISPKLRGKMMSKQIKAQKYAMDESKDDLKSISDNAAYATKDGIRVAAGAIKEGFTQNSIFCKYCGKRIDEDSRFCKNCGKEQ